MKVNRISLVLLVLLSASLCVAQSDKKKAESKAKPDLSGTWILDPANSKVDREISYYVLTIVHREPDITLIKKYKQGKREINEEVTYHTDGKPESPHPLLPNDPPPETRWRGNKLVRRVTHLEPNDTPEFLARNPLDLVVINTEEWALSDDRQTLVRTLVTTRGADVKRKTKAVFRRSL